MLGGWPRPSPTGGSRLCGDLGCLCCAGMVHVSPEVGEAETGLCKAVPLLRLLSQGWCQKGGAQVRPVVGIWRWACVSQAVMMMKMSVTNADFLCLGRKSTDDPGWPEPYPMRLFLGQLPSCSSRVTALGEPAPNMPAGRGGAAVGTGKLQASSQGCLLASRWTKMRRGVPMSSHQPHSRVHTPSAVLALGDHRE